MAAADPSIPTIPALWAPWEIICAPPTWIRAPSFADAAVRLDKWLWAARFFKTRSLAAQAIGGGKVELNGDRAKRSKLLQVGDQIRVRHGPFEYTLVVRVLSEQRGPAVVAATLYEEMPASKKARETLAAQMKLAKVPRFEGKGRPTKRDRRDLEKLRGLDN